MSYEVIGNGSNSAAAGFFSTSFPVEYGVNVTVTPNPARATAKASGSIAVDLQAAPATARGVTLEPTVPEAQPDMAIGTMTIGTTFEVA